MRKYSLILLATMMINNVSRADGNNSAIITNDTMVCNNWEYLIDAIWRMSLVENGDRRNDNAIDRLDVERNKWISSGKCEWLAKGTRVIIEYTLPLKVVVAHPVDSLSSYSIWESDLTH